MINYSETILTGAEPILFIHGLGASRWMWWQQESAFSDYPLIMVDLPGHGKTAATSWVSLADSAEQIAQQVIKDRAVHIVGLSLGGHVALELAKHFPEKVLSLFISGITVKPLHYGFLLKLQSRAVQRTIHNKPHLEKLAREYYRLPPEKIPEFISNYQLLTRETYEAIFKEIIRFHLDASYSSFHKPALFAAGGQESRAIIASIEIAPVVMPNAVGMLIPSARHDWPIQHATEFNRLLRKWITKNLYEEKDLPILD
ncbi:alpha/beta hydrolase [Planococcus sp. CP5-4]|uniref:alpha/beta fold hydrolase n=1 Tax=unclassified Planococcus (in: firmicutes) TaxID=2662419 RepID=UPI001C2349C5|nr:MULTISPECIES: alpha/beta hydrolase [unclassified Planococcus (in: firmicutes)]MBU9674316.1 alpha/beta hydrolase [Planococcus sp. CP5-4_YE]MBV0909097.1 alpha/beta hydrolase [Planococcus sp. CP5-4_UN]MBW6065007.1 alpha/beta hydrolase [Planococcus sp. CP5-4]